MTDRDVDLNKIKLRGFPVQNKHGMGNKVPPQRSKVRSNLGFSFWNI